MSGIGGIFHRDGRPLTDADLHPLSAALLARGPDRGGRWSSGPAGMVHQALDTTPEARNESQPVILPGGDQALVADARLDNRDELASALGLSAQLDRLGDAELLARAYQLWGTECPTRLLGDFAFAAWDRPNRRLFCARDPFGVKPLFLHVGDAVAAFASEVRALLSLPWVPRRRNDLQIALYLEEVTEDESASFYRDILALPAGHWLLIEPHRVVRHRYYRLDPRRELPDGDVEGYAEEYQRLFREAVRCRLRCARPVGSLLSGGLDSSSIVCAAREIRGPTAAEPFPTFSLIFDQVPEADERPFMSAVLAGGGLRSHVLHGDQLAPLGDAAYLERPDGACYGANLFLNRGLFRLAAQQGVRVLLDGTDGDTVVGYGFERLVELFTRLRFATLAREITALAPHLKRSRRRVLRSLVVAPLLRAARALCNAEWQRICGSSAPPRALPAAPGRLGVRPEFARRVGLWQHVASQRAVRPSAAISALSVRQAQLQGLESGILPTALGFLDRAAGDLGVEPRYPFFDRRLVEFCLALPSSARLHQGWNRYIQRLAGANLPDRVRWRGWKTQLGANLARGLAQFDRNVLEQAVAGDSPLEQFVELEQARSLLARFLARPRPVEAFQLSKLATLAMWLRSARLGES